MERFHFVFFFPFSNFILFVLLNIAIIFDLPLEVYLCFGEIRKLRKDI